MVSSRSDLKPALLPSGACVTIRAKFFTYYLTLIGNVDEPWFQARNYAAAITALCLSEV